MASHSMEPCKIPDYKANTEEVNKLTDIIRERLPRGGMIAVSGLPTSGKSTLVKQLINGLGGYNAGRFSFDSLYFDREKRRELEATGCHPESFDPERAKDILEQIKRGDDLVRIVKDYEGSRPITAGLYEPKIYNFVDGTAALLNGCFELYDFIVFVSLREPDDEQKRRDLRSGDTERIRIMRRGAGMLEEQETEAQQLLQVKRREHYKKYIDPFFWHADVVVTSSTDFTLKVTEIKRMPEEKKKEDSPGLLETVDT